MRWIRRPFVVFVLAVTLVLSGCSVCESPSAELIGEWEAEGFIVDACTGEIDGKPYLFLLTRQGSSEVTIHVLDVADPVEPIEVAALEAPMGFLFPLGGLILSGMELYVGLSESEAALWVVDVSDPASPREIALQEKEFAVWKPCVSGNYLAVNTDIWGRCFAFFDISRPAQPRLLGELALTVQSMSSSGWHADYVGSMFYVVVGAGLAITDVSSPGLPQEAGFYTNPDWEPAELEGVEGAGTSVISWMEEFGTLEELLDDMFASGSFFDVAVSDGYAYIAASDSGLVVLDVRDPESPEEVARLEIPGKAVHVLNAGDLAYIMGVSFTGGSTIDSFRHSVYIVDISDPLAPELADSIEVVATFPPWQSMITLGDYIYFLSNQTVYVIDIYGGCR